MKTQIAIALLLFFFSGQSFAQNYFRALLGANIQECRGLYNPQAPGYATNLVAYWNLDGTVGTIATGAIIPSTLSGGPTATATISSSSLSYATGIINQGITANGTAADYVSAGTPTALNGLTAGTWMMWMKVTLGTSMKLFYKSDNNGSAGYYFILGSDKRLKFVKVYGTTNMQSFTPTLASSYFSGSWHQVVVTWDGTANSSGVHIYTDGTEFVYSTTDSRVDTSSGNTSYAQNGAGTASSDAAYPFILLGSPSSTGTNPTANAFSGTMDEFAVWNRVLTATEVARLYQHQKCN